MDDEIILSKFAEGDRGRGLFYLSFPKPSSLTENLFFGEQDPSFLRILKPRGEGSNEKRECPVVRSYDFLERPGLLEMGFHFIMSEKFSQPFGLSKGV